MTDVNVKAARDGATTLAMPAFSFNDVTDRRERLILMQQAVNDGASAIAQNWTSFSRTLARFPWLSPANILLVMAQHPEARLLASRRRWMSAERVALQRGIAVLAPVLRHSSNPDGSKLWRNGRPVVEATRHRPASVFEYAATAGAPVVLPWERLSGAPRPGFVNDLVAAAGALGFAVEVRAGASDKRRVLSLGEEPTDAGSVRALARAVGVAAGAGEGADLFAFALCQANGLVAPMPALPEAPWPAVVACRRALREVLGSTRFVNLLGV